VKREVHYRDGLPVSITLPKAEQFIHGGYTDGGSCGCVVGHALYAFGCDFNQGNRGSICHRVTLAEKFAADVCAHAFALKVTKRARVCGGGTPYGLKNGDECETWEAFDKRMHLNIVKTRKQVAHSWRVVADRWGYDVKASEPEWKP
jgi:hypothetical protein